MKFEDHGLITAIDSNVLLDVLLPGDPHADESKMALTYALNSGSLIVCEPVLAEIFPVLRNQALLADFLLRTGIRLEHSKIAALTLAGEKWFEFTQRRPGGMTCAVCGNVQAVSCATCGAAIRSRQHVLSDFLIGAHAQTQADALLTRDRGYFKTYFPDLVLL